MPPILITLFFLALFPIALSSIGGYYRVKQFGHLDNQHPRAQQARMEGPGARAIAAHKNAWEALAMYSVAIFIAFANGVDLHSLTLPALIFLTARLFHAFFYIADLSTLRSFAFAIGFFDCIYIFAIALIAN
jgi:uncharacterized MAPEG superfamily protein